MVDHVRAYYKARSRYRALSGMSREVEIQFKGERPDPFGRIEVTLAWRRSVQKRMPWARSAPSWVRMRDT